MPEIISVKYDDGSQWEAVPNGFFADAGVFVPLASITSLDDWQIVERIKQLRKHIEMAEALTVADLILMDANLASSERSKHKRIERHLEEWQLLRPFKGKNEKIDNALHLLDEVATKNNERYIHRKHVMNKRRVIAANYDQIFVALGRRDGFSCRECGVSTDLQIDHIVAVANGGGNEMDNLQLLCASCNLAKSDS